MKKGKMKNKIINIFLNIKYKYNKYNEMINKYQKFKFMIVKNEKKKI